MPSDSTKNAKSRRIRVYSDRARALSIDTIASLRPELYCIVSVLPFLISSCKTLAAGITTAAVCSLRKSCDPAKSIERTPLQVSFLSGDEIQQLELIRISITKFQVGFHDIILDGLKRGQEKDE